jgi:hypothetical protein
MVLVRIGKPAFATISFYQLAKFGLVDQFAIARQVASLVMPPQIISRERGYPTHHMGPVILEIVYFTPTLRGWSKIRVTWSELFHFVHNDKL